MIEPLGPVILLGRGGSGTRMLSELAQRCNVFIGNELNASGDSVEWVGLIYRLSEKYIETRAKPDLDDVESVTAQGKRFLEDRRGSHGWWGWKLPETMLVLPTLLTAYPQARVVHIVRHPITSALRRTHKTSRLTNSLGRKLLAAAYRSRGADAGLMSSDQGFLHNAMSWELQVRGAIEALDRHPATSALLLRYEDVCSNWPKALAEVSHFLGQPAPAGEPNDVVDPARMNCLEKAMTEMNLVWEICGKTAEKLGFAYDDWCLEGEVALAARASS